ncbi:MAG: 30S ribosomal protein S16 [Elusimicrobia bacterium RIFOXYA2_FULL_50_26]|nr:MAG: 30S ribosomal protein S16 [Elusimicrobia bacterium RIFOXYA2_FULL_50_26]OGS25162.1 MAG: 30S ribosomal protein S16 [Elusimicrobia bacterium RIFOXYB2_FULL_50_12]
MTVRVRMQRQGRPNRPYYRVVAIDRRSRRDGKPIEILGQYDPLAEKNKITIKQERVDYWVKQGAQLSRTVASLLKNAPKAV